jgi:hypothetical protein
MVLSFYLSHSFAPPSVLPDISPTRREIGSSAARLVISTAGNWRNQSGKLISPRVGEMSGRTEGGAVERQLNHDATGPSS